MTLVTPTYGEGGTQGPGLPLRMMDRKRMELEQGAPGHPPHRVQLSASTGTTREVRL